MVAAVETMAYAGEVPWHGLGVQVSNDLTPQQMMEKASLDWDVKKYATYTEFKGKRVPLEKKALIRMSDGKVLTEVGPDWNEVQNADAFQFFYDFVLAGDMEMHTAGSLKDGRLIWVLAKVKESFDLFGGDKVDSYLLFSNPHLYGKSIDVKFTPIRVVCNNTLTMALNTKNKVSYTQSHRTIFDPEMVKETMGLASEKFSKYKEMAEFLGKKKVTAENLLAYFDDVFPRTSGKKEVKEAADLSRNAKLCVDVLEKQPGANFAEGSYWQAFNAVTYVTDHLQGRNADNRLYSNWFGSNEARKARAAQIAVKMAEAA